MSLYAEVVKSIKKNKQIKSKGGFVGIPLPFPRLSQYYPVLERGHSIGVLAGTGVGKSRFSRYLGIYHVYKFYKQTGYKVRIFYFPLEDNKEKVYKSFICHYLYEQHNIVLTLQELDSKGDRELPDFVEEKIKESEKFFEEFEQIVTVIDGFTEPKQIFDVLQNYALSTGTVSTYEVDIAGKKEKQKIYESDTHTFVVLDNMANIDKSDEHANERAAMVEMARIYIRERLCNFFKFTVIQLLQNDFATERQQFNASGKSIMSKVEPSLASIGEAKTISRSMHIIFTLFDPARYEFLRYPAVSEQNANKAYDIELLGNRFRALKIIKNNDGDVGMRAGILMNAITETFEELPAPDSPEMKEIYSRLKNKNEKFIKSKNVLVFEEEYKDEENDSPF